MTLRHVCSPCGPTVRWTWPGSLLLPEPYMFLPYQGLCVSMLTQTPCPVIVMPQSSKCLGIPFPPSAVTEVNGHRSLGERTGRIITTYVVVLQGSSLWGPGYLFSLWIPDLKTDSNSQTERGIKTFYWGNCLWSLAHKLSLLVIYDNKRYPCWLPIHFAP